MFHANSWVVTSLHVHVHAGAGAVGAGAGVDASASAGASTASNIALILFFTGHLGVEILYLGYQNTYARSFTGMAAHTSTHQQCRAFCVESVKWHSSAVGA